MNACSCRLRAVAALGAGLVGWLLGGVAGQAADPLEVQNVVWTSPSTNLWGTMPLGNGDVSVNAWVEPDGDLRFYVGKSDTWDAHARLLKLGLVRIALSPNPFVAGAPFRQELRLRQAEIALRGGSGANETRLRVWIDAHRPVVHVEGESATPVAVRAVLEPWRMRARAITGEEAQGSDTFTAEEPVVSDPDTEVDTERPAVAWYHRNVRSIWASTLRHQGLGSWIPEGRDPLLNRTFGGWLRGEGFARRDTRTLATPAPVRRFHLTLQLLTAQTDTSAEWVRQVESQANATAAVPVEEARSAHARWWDEFWNRSWVRVAPAEGAAASVAGEVDAVNRAYVLQRFLSAGAGRGALPIKFNGSLYTVPPPGGFDADYRRWGGCYWFQNTRLPYWPMLAGGDLDCLEPLFRMYRDALPLALARTRLYFGHGGAYFSETGHFWGAWHNGDLGWGWARTNEPPNRSLNQYIRFHWSSGIELLAMMLERQAFAPDEAFLRETLLPLGEAVLTFYAEHYPRQPDGRILFVPAQALETWWETENPTPEVAGLRYVLPQMLALPSAVVGESRFTAWRKLLAELPPVPRRTEGGRTFVLPAEAFRTKRNMENAELYAVFPFRVFGVGRPDLEVGRETFRRREFKGNVGWQQDETQAAFLGMVEEARPALVRRALSKHPESRFPAFWGPNFDWIPDQDHGGNALMTLQTMLLQHDGRRIHLLPAWPKDWDAEFRLHAPGRTVVEGSVRGGKLARWGTTPTERGAEVEVDAAWR